MTNEIDSKFKVGDTIETKKEGFVLLDSQSMIEGAVRRLDAGEVLAIHPLNSIENRL